MEGEIPRSTVFDMGIISENQDSVPKQSVSGEESSRGGMMGRFTGSGHLSLDIWKGEYWSYRNQKNQDINLPQETCIHKTINCEEEQDFEYSEDKSFDIDIKSVNLIHDILQVIPLRNGSPKCDQFKSTFKLKNLDLVGKQPVQYTDCESALSLSTDNTRHQKSHTTANSYDCDQCGKAFSRSSSLIRHQIIHTGEKPYKCNECGRFFNRRTNLTKHQKLHSDTKTYEGNKLKVFTRSEDNDKSVQLHAESNPYECVDCGKSFNRSSSLIRHQMIHTGEKPFKCKECKKTFNRSSNLIKHQKLHARDKS
ncbi:zinc finger protein 215 isoform X2 [Tupaia chinensis]|nr:zinc finger protein 215 isoform X2 [Tupaia chinensis]